ncbi:amidohydrolase family protein [Sphingobium sp. EM0848]|uniref:amidohydrolase family protein n=1 Tax=Sphingobium sp. EM0848 TaxID=2743473 RepID=UPI0021008A64|nr:amidohydrolase family protein [Sphingobium sp. EM0848]
MTDAGMVSLRNPAMNEVGLAYNRPLDGRSAQVPQGTIVVSADNHWSIAEDLWEGRVPAAMRDRVPSVWWDEERGIHNMGISGKPSFVGPAIVSAIKSIEDRPGIYSMPERLADLDADGIAMEVVFPQSLLMYFQHPDLEARGWIFRAYNEYMAEVGTRAPGRFFGVGYPNFWDISKAEESIRHIKDLGLKTFQIPITPGLDVNGKTIFYASEEMDRFWSAAEEAELPVCFHIGETLNFEIPGGAPCATFTNLAPFRKNFGELVFGGILDRHPRLQIVFAEAGAGINWVPGILQDAEMVFDSFGPMMNPKLKQRPTDYWAQNCYATFMADSLGLKLVDYVGTDKLLWSADYPHNEGTLGYTGAVISEIVDSVSEGDAKKMLGGNAIRLFDLA